MQISPPRRLQNQDARWGRELLDACASSCRHLHDAEQALTISRASVARSKDRIAQSARTCAAAREAVVRTGGSKQRARDAVTIRAKIDCGILPSERPDKVFAGYGEEQPCTGCGKPILPAQVEWTLRDTHEITHRFHVGCFRHWEAELCRRGVRRAS